MHVLAPEISYGILRNMQVGVKLPFAAVSGAGGTDWGFAGARLLALYNFNTESLALPAFSLRADLALPGGSLAGDDPQLTLKAIATRSWGRTGGAPSRLASLSRLLGGGYACRRAARRHARHGSGPLELSTAASVRTPTFGILQLEAMGQAEWTSHYRVRGTTLFSGGVRAYRTPGSGARAWVGRYHGQASSLGTRRPLQRSEFGGSARLGAVHLEFSVANTTVDRSLMFGPSDPRGGDTLSSDPLPTGQKQVERVALTDAVLSGRWRISSLDFDASYGRRFSRFTPETTIWGLSASRSISPSLALVAAAGRAGSDPVTSVPGARYFALGLRLKVGSQVMAPLPAPATPTATAPFRIRPAVAAGREIVIQAADARAVELAGDFTDWKPVALQPWGDDGWRALLPIAPGLHRLAIRIDGGAWQAPSGTRPITSFRRRSRRGRRRVATPSGGPPLRRIHARAIAPPGNPGQDRTRLHAVASSGPGHGRRGGAPGGGWALVLGGRVRSGMLRRRRRVFHPVPGGDRWHRGSGIGWIRWLWSRAKCGGPSGPSPRAAARLR